MEHLTRIDRTVAQLRRELLAREPGLTAQQINPRPTQGTLALEDEEDEESMQIPLF